MRSRLSLGAPTALFHFLIALLVQAECLALYVRGGPAQALALPLFQLQTLGVAAALGLLAALAWPWRPSRALALLFAFATTALVLADQLTMKLVLSHLQLGLAKVGPGDLGRLLSSARAEADRWTALNLAALVLLAALLHAPAVHARIAALAARVSRSPVAMALLLATAAASAWLGPKLDPLAVRVHPLVALAASTGGPRQDKPPAGCADLAAEPAPVDAPPQPDFAELRARAKARRGRPNLVLIVLESVGSRRLLRGGSPDPILAPTLSKLAEQGAVFENIYGLYPATTRTHVALATGGRASTWSGVVDTFALPWTGATLAGELKKAGYRSALISAQGLQFEQLDLFYAREKFDLIVDPDAPSSAGLAASGADWGISERAVLPEALRFIRAEPDRPFFVQLLTNSTHHPYLAPGAEKLPAPERHAAALKETDAALKTLFDSMAAAGRLKNTIIAVTGDHGEAFDERKINNWCHSNYGYEENLQSFLLVHDAATVSKQIRSAQIGGIGDVAPTLLSLLGLPAADMPGQDLIGPAYVPRVQFFHAGGELAFWGLRDGRWKYQARQGGAQPELYDLATDPGETKNLATAHRERVAQAECRVRRWYVRADNDYNAHVVGRTDPRPPLTVTDAAKPPPAPIGLSFGGSSFHPWEPMAADLEWTPDENQREERLELTAPSGRMTVATVLVEPGETRTQTPIPGPLPLEEGHWKVAVRELESDPEQITGSFEVSALTPPSRPVEGLLPIEATFSVDEEGPALIGSWSPEDAELRLELELTSPGKAPRKLPVIAAAAAPVALAFTPPLEAGRWRIEVRTIDGHALGETMLRIPSQHRAQR